MARPSKALAADFRGGRYEVAQFWTIRCRSLIDCWWIGVVDPVMSKEPGRVLMLISHELSTGPNTGQYSSADKIILSPFSASCVMYRWSCLEMASLTAGTLAALSSRYCLATWALSSPGIVSSSCFNAESYCGSGM